MKSSIQEQFSTIDISDLPRFDDCRSILERALWVLWAAKEKLQKKMLSAEQIACVLRDVQEISIRATSITQALRRAGDRIHSYQQSGEVFYEIMKPGKEYLTSLRTEGEIEVFYFEPDKRYSSKRLLVTNILKMLLGEIRIVDPYFGERTLDVITDVKGSPIKFLTKLENITNANARNKLLRELKDFKTENADVEFRDYPNRDLHDRYIISPTSLVLLGYSMKDLGAKESFAVVLNKASSKNIYEAVRETFDRRWKESNTF